MSSIESLIRKLVPLFGAESDAVKDLVKRYNDLSHAKAHANDVTFDDVSPIAKPMASTTIGTTIKAQPLKTDQVESEVARIEAMRQKLSKLQDQLSLPTLSEESVSVIKKQISVLKSALGVREKTFEQIKSGWSSIEGVGNGIASMTEALQGNGSAWEKICAVVDGTIQIFESFQSIISIIEKLTAVTGLFKAAKIGEGDAAMTAAGKNATAVGIEVAGTATAIAAKNGLATASVAAAAGETMSSHAGIPFVGIAIAAGLIAAMIATMMSLPKFASGGIAYGPTLGLFGEYSGASHNPEVVAPLNRLRSLISPAYGSGNVVFRIQGRELVGVLQNESNIRSRG